MKVCLAYSGGLDTSVCIPLLREHYKYDEVVSVTVDIGQPDIKDAEERGRKLADLHYTVDAREEFVESIFQLIKANGNYEGYILGAAISRPLIARKVVEVARKEKADAVAHGCTGKGNDQLRFENIFRCSPFKIVAPIRDLSLTRKEEFEYAKKHGIKIKKSMQWSIDENLWYRSIEGGELEESSTVPPEEIYKWTTVRRKVRKIIKIGFQNGIPVSLDGRKLDGISLIKRLNRIAGSYGIGRTDMMEDRVLGYKARENYEHPAASVLLQAHKDLEQLVLTRRELSVKYFIDQWWSELVYEGLTPDPLFDALNAFIDSTQSRVTGWVKVCLSERNARVVARWSPFSLMVKDSSFDVRQERRIDGVLEHHGLQGRIFRDVLKK